MLRIKTCGTPYQRGIQQGQATRELARPWLDRHWEALLQRYAADTPAELLKQIGPQVTNWRRQLATLYPAGEEECRGLARGLDLDEDIYFTLTFYHRLGGHLPQCTTVGYRDPLKHPRLGKTDDIGVEDLGMNILEDTHPNNGYRHLHCHFAGTIWSVAGMNECGLAMGMTGIPGPLNESSGLFSLTALDTILPTCANVQETIAHLHQLDLNAYGFSLLLGDTSGDLALIEKTGAGMVVLDPTIYPLAHTNHILDPDLAERNPAQSEPIRSNGQRRLETARTLLAKGLSPDQIIGDRTPSGPICQRGEGDLHTDFAVVFAPVEGLMHLWPGYPDQVTMETFNIREHYHTG